MISERTLRQWRKDALLARAKYGPADATDANVLVVQLSDVVLRITQELLDQILIRKDTR